MELSVIKHQLVQEHFVTKTMLIPWWLQIKWYHHSVYTNYIYVWRLSPTLTLSVICWMLLYFSSFLAFTNLKFNIFVEDKDINLRLQVALLEEILTEKYFDVICCNSYLIFEVIYIGSAQYCSADTTIKS